MLRSITLLFVAIALPVHADAHVASDAHRSWNSVDTLANKQVDNLLLRALRVVRLSRTDLDNSVLAKTAAHAGLSPQPVPAQVLKHQRASEIRIAPQFDIAVRGVDNDVEGMEDRRAKAIARRAELAQETQRKLNVAKEERAAAAQGKTREQILTERAEREKVEQEEKEKKAKERAAEEERIQAEKARMKAAGISVPTGPSDKSKAQQNKEAEVALTEAQLRLQEKRAERSAKQAALVEAEKARVQRGR